MLGACIGLFIIGAGYEGLKKLITYIQEYNYEDDVPSEQNEIDYGAMQIQEDTALQKYKILYLYQRSYL